MNNEPNENQAFRGAVRAHGYMELDDEHTAVRGEAPRAAMIDRVPQTGDIPETASPATPEQLLARFQQDDPAATAQTAATQEPDQAVVADKAIAVPSADVRLRSRHRVAEQPSIGMRGFLRKLGFSMSPSAAEQEAADLGSARSYVRLSTWRRSVGILVANPKGGVGKTPLSLAIAGALATTRGGGTIAFEVSDDPGALSVRAEGPASVGVAELLRDIDQVTGAGQLAGYVAKQTSYAAVISTVGDRDPLTGDDVRRMAKLTDTYYPVRVMDSGNVPSSDAFHGALDVTDVLVIPVLDALDALQGAMQLLRHLHQLGGKYTELARQAVVVRMHDGRPEDPEVRAYAEQLITSAGISAVYEVPYDAHIAGRSTLSYSDLSAPTQKAITMLTAGIVGQLNKKLNQA